MAVSAGLDELRQIKKLERKDLLGMHDLSSEEVELILDVADCMKGAMSNANVLSECLRGKSLATAFYEPSTRTRTSFERAGKALGMSVTNLQIDVSSVAKGESLKDTALTLQSVGYDAIVIRHWASGAPHFIAKYVSASVINAGDGMHEHPTQALLDLYTMRKVKGRLHGLKIAIIGDILHSRVARSIIFALSKFNSELVVCGPPTMLPRAFSEFGVKVAKRIEEAIEGADIIYMLRIQLERQRVGLFPSIGEYAKLYGMTLERVRLASEDAIVMHPGPMNRGVEIASDLADSEKARILDQVTNGVAVRMAVLWLLLGSQ
ncbi:MAG: aspartate carbamoyltransferase catalytic subunit [Armatimonadetes bacterium]|nr:aspartate carbamoyltransferase catalytic subunit [Armatimonadota bacterium]